MWYSTVTEAAAVAAIAEEAAAVVVAAAVASVAADEEEENVEADSFVDCLPKNEHGASCRPWGSAARIVVANLIAEVACMAVVVVVPVRRQSVFVGMRKHTNRSASAADLQLRRIHLLPLHC